MQPLKLSPCHFKPITENDTFLVNPPVQDDVYHYCSHCGAEVRKPIVWPDPHMGSTSELMIRRYKDGDITFASVEDALNQSVRDNLTSLMNHIREQLDDGKPDMWEMRPGSLEWEKTDDNSA